MAYLENRDIQRDEGDPVIRHAKSRAENLRLLFAVENFIFLRGERRLFVA